jgi:hypothetical protein
VVAADAFVDLLQDVLAFIPWYALHEYSRSSTLPVELVSDLYTGLGSADELFGHVLIEGNLLLVDVVDEGLSPVKVDHLDLPTRLRWSWVNGRGAGSGTDVV